MSLLRAEVILPVQTACVLQCFAGKPCRNFFFFFFPEEEVSGAALLALNDRMVQQLAKKIGHQAVLMDLIKKYKQNSQALQSPGSPRQTALIRQTEAAPENEQSSSPASCGEQMPSFCPAENLDNEPIDQRVLKQRYPSTQQYNNVVNALLQAHPFLDEDGCGFFLWKRALKDRFKYVRRPIEDDEQVMRNKCKFGHRRGQKRKSLADLKCDEIHSVQMKKEAVCLDSEVNEHINWFQQEYVKTEKDWREIDNRMTQTLELRRKLIDSRTPLKDILKMFPFLKCPHQIFREFQLLTRTDIYKKTQHILESYSENILTSFIVADNPINIALQEKMKQYTDEDMLKQMKMTATCLLLPDVFGDDPSLFVVVNEKVQVSTPVLEVKNPFNINDCEFSLYLEKERLTKVDDCVMALAALIAAFHVFGIKCPQRLRQTLKFLKTLIFDMHHPYFPPITGKKGRFQHSAI
ncbi:sterile alpha motif domain-containing protein 3 isoform X6 [Elephas maximus indicus]|uniref:sterile alpha motif domain-containing protein 3 isoform X6 n=1 Tax=Elephas maximus indicus TaxID=99487 RepID=UPI002115DCD1|nr:sterile alpha motif domain-containing protein 3 isoform X6 [Elephas maximus indicus]